MTTLSYTDDHLYLGTIKSKCGCKKSNKAQEAFPNAKRVVLKVADPEEQLEGEIGTESVNTETAQHSASTEQGEAHNDSIQESPKNLLSDSEGISDTHTPAEDLAEEILSEDPPALTDLIMMGDSTVDIHQSIIN